MSIKKHRLHNIGRATVHLTGGSVQKICRDCRKTFIVSYKFKGEDGIVYDNYPNEECPNASER